MLAVLRLRALFLLLSCVYTCCAREINPRIQYAHDLGARYAEAHSTVALAHDGYGAITTSSSSTTNSRSEAFPQRGVGLGPPYEYPNHTEHVLIVGAFPYARGPAVWNDTMQSDRPFGGWGLAEGWTYNLAHRDESGHCPPIPEDQWGLGLDQRRLFVREGPNDACFIGCNISEIAAGAEDPCNGGSFWMDTPRFGRVLANFSCFWGGPTFLEDPTVGQCGFNCTAFDIYNKTPCNIWEANPPKGVKPVCNIECDPRKF